MRCSLVLIWFCALAAGAAADGQLAPELATLSRIKSRMSETLSRQPNYTCVQQVERSHRRLPKGRYELHDLLRIEVALVDGKEMYAWPGARKFEDIDLTSMVSSGAIGTGNFATHAKAVFMTSAPRFRHVGSAELNGRSVVRYDFVVPLFGSGYSIRVRDNQSAVVGYHGSFWADSQSHELVRLEVVADDIPPFLGVSSAQDAVEYERMKIGQSEFLLPRTSELTMADLQGNESRNRTLFTSCRQYAGESVLTFAEAPADSAPAETELAPEPKDTIELPGDLSFDVKLQTEIDSTTAAVGDPVTAILADDIKVKRRLIAQKGATLFGRIVRLERFGEFTVLDLQFFEIDSERVHGTLRASVDSTVDFSQRFLMQRTNFDARQRLATVDGMKFRGPRFRLRAGDRVPLRTHEIVPEPPARTVYQ